METLENMGKMKRVCDGRHKVDYPACTIGRNGFNFYCYLNAIARRHFDPAEQGVNWYVNEDDRRHVNYIIAMPSTAVNAYKPIIKQRGGIYTGYSFPKSLVDEGKVNPGMYKLYRYKSGFAFKPYEPIKEEDIDG